MSESVIEVQIRAVFPTTGGCAVFLGDDAKVFVIYIDQTVGAAISMAMRGIPAKRPQTHDLIGDILRGVGAEVRRVVINDFDDGVYYARLILEIDNEFQQRKIIEIDARPSDSIAIAVGAGAPVYVARHVWDEADDMSDVLEKIEAEEGDSDRTGEEEPP